MNAALPQPLATLPASAPLSGVFGVPGDQSISHCALILAALAVGKTHISGLHHGHDVLRTVSALRQLGVPIIQLDDGRWQVQGVGVGGLLPPDDILDMGNAGTAACLMLGLLATMPSVAIITGDPSLRRRPMAQVMAPLTQMGAVFAGGRAGHLPVTVTGTSNPMPIDHVLGMPSAQVKSAIMLAALNTPGTTRITETIATRDHIERLLRHFGVPVISQQQDNGDTVIHLTGYAELRAADIAVPADPSSAAFLVAAALLVPGSEMTIKNVCVNPHRIGLYTTLRAMGAVIDATNEREQNGEMVADMHVRYSPLQGVTVPANRAASMIDEYPVLAVCAALAAGQTRLCGVHDAQSDRLAVMTKNLAACGVDITRDDDDLIIKGGAPPRGGCAIITHHDPRIAMSFYVLGLVCQQPMQLDDFASVDAYFPDFLAVIRA